MSRRALVLLLSCALAACREEPPPPPPSPTGPPAVIQATPGNDEDNSLNLMYGGAVVWRGGELHLENSAVHTIDGFAETTWTSAPGAPEETLVFSMLAPTRLRRVGISTNPGDDGVHSVAFDASMDGKTWTELGTLRATRTDERQFLTVEPTVAHYLRVRIIDPAKRYYVRLRGVHALGEEIAAPETPSFAGCWTINGERATLEQHGARITGVIASDPPTYIDGGTDNRAGMIQWLRGPTSGYAVLTRSPDGRHLSGLSFFGEVDKNIGEGWFGERCKDPLPVSADPRRFLDAAKRYTLYGLVFDPNEQLVEEVSAPTLDAVAALVASSPQRLRIVAHELRYATDVENKQRTDARIRSIRAALAKRGVDPARIDFVSGGGDTRGIVVRSALQRFLLSRVDLVSGT